MIRISQKCPECCRTRVFQERGVIEELQGNDKAEGILLSNGWRKIDGAWYCDFCAKLEKFRIFKP